MRNDGVRACFIVVIALLCTFVAACNGGGNSARTATRAPSTAASGSPTPNSGTPVGEASPAASATVGAGGTSTAVATASGVRACSRGDVQARANEQGVPGSIGGSLTLTNISSSACTLGRAGAKGPPDVTLVDGNGATIATQATALPGISLNSVALPQNQSTSITFVWSNWCKGPPASPVAIALALGSGPAATAAISGSDATADATPRCDDASQPSGLEVSGFSEPR